MNKIRLRDISFGWWVVIIIVGVVGGFGYSVITDDYGIELGWKAYLIFMFGLVLGIWIGKMNKNKPNK